MKRTGPTNETLRKLIRELKKVGRLQKVNIWGRIAEDLSKSTRSRREINLYKINKYAKENETVVVPGKVLGEGELDHDVTVAAWKFSQSAKDKIKKAMSIEKLLKENPKGSKVRIIG